jgi:very-short-patch-repair endonuclease
MTGGNYSHLERKAKEKRKEPTSAEKVLLMELKSKALDHINLGKHLIDNFIVDFVCLSKISC